MHKRPLKGLCMLCRNTESKYNKHTRLCCLCIIALLSVTMACTEGSPQPQTTQQTASNSQLAKAVGSKAPTKQAAKPESHSAIVIRVLTR